MNTYSLVAQALLGVMPHINLALVGGNDSSSIESAASTAALTNSTNNTNSIFETSTANIPSLMSMSITRFVTTQIVVDIVQSSDGTTSSEQLVDSEIPRITIDTIIAAVRPQEITVASSKRMTTATAAPRPSDVSFPTLVTSTD
ncbi:hypothetical protein F4781DRAFT_178885 [Annulohypoxylon bovei var. microspora]|nr:hypothetical protein F4781DRAFT_178885 [Annulohypoxylon bovei var. microspora]